MELHIVQAYDERVLNVLIPKHVKIPDDHRKRVGEVEGKLLACYRHDNTENEAKDANT